MVAAFEDRCSEAEVVQQLSSDPRKLPRFFERGEIRSCYEASGAGYVLRRDITESGHDCEVISPSPGEYFVTRGVTIRYIGSGSAR